MRYIIMCGGKYKFPKQLVKVKGEILLERTIRLLRENGVEDIAISTNDKRFEYLGVPLLRHRNEFESGNSEETKESRLSWVNAYYPSDEPCCYLHGDVYFSDEAIKTIVNTPVEDTMFFCTCDGTDMERDPRNWKGREPFAYKVVNQEVFRYVIKKILKMVDNGEFVGLPPLAWTVYRYLNGYDIGRTAKEYTDVNNIFRDPGDYVVIDDYTTDVDSEWDIEEIEKHVW